MKNKKGFTLIELLGVIALLAVLTLLVVPNILKLFNTSKRNIFLSEAKTLYNEAIKKYSLELATSDGLDIISSNGDNKLSLNGENIDYCILFNSEGKITSLKATNGKYYIEYTESGIDGLTVEKVIEGSIDLTNCSSSQVPVNNCTFDGNLVQGAEYINGQYTYRYMQEKTDLQYSWQNISEVGWGVMLTDKNSTNAVTTPLCITINGKPIVSMSYMFDQSQATSIDLRSFDTSNVVNMNSMFHDTKATELDLDSFDTSKVTDMRSMFRDSKATTIYVSDKWNTSNVISSTGMFVGVTNLVGGEGTTCSLFNPDDKTYAHVDGGVSNPGYFTDKDQIEEEPSAPTRPVNNCTYNGNLVQGAEYTNGQYTYRYMQELLNGSWSNITADGWGVTLTDKDSTNAVTTPLCTSINGKPIVSMRYMFYESQATTLDLSSFDTSNVTTMSDMFRASQATTLDLSSFDTSNVTNMSSMFGYSQATELDLSGFDTSNVTNMQKMFSRSQATTLDLSSFDTSKVTNMRDMFERSQATTLDLSSFDTSKVTNMSNMFSSSQATQIIGLDKFDTSNVTDMRSMFYESKATIIDLSSFDTSKVTKMVGMFSYSQAITIYVSNKWNTSNVTESPSMFWSVTNLVGGEGTTYSSSNPDDKTYAHVDGGVSNPGYFTYKAN